MKKYFKTILNFIGSLLFLTLTILFTINALEIFSLGHAQTSVYYVIYILCLAFVTVLFAIKGIEHLINDTPLRDKFTARKQARAQLKAEKAEADKQAKIQALEQQLDELKKD